MSEITAEELVALCDHVVGRRDLFSYMDVARAMCVRCHRRQGGPAARSLAERLEISPQTLWNWLNRDLPEWSAKMQARREAATMGAAVDYPARGRRISAADLAMIAGLMRSKQRRLSSRQLCREIRRLAFRDASWGHLKNISHSFLHRKRHLLNQLVAEAEREEYFRRKAARDAAPSVSATEGMSSPTAAEPVAVPSAPSSAAAPVAPPSH